MAGALRELASVSERLGRGDLEARLGPLGVPGLDPEVETGLREAFNGLADVIDAYVRESGAAMIATSEGRFHRPDQDARAQRQHRGGQGR